MKEIPFRGLTLIDGILDEVPSEAGMTTLQTNEATLEASVDLVNPCIFKMLFGYTPEEMEALSDEDRIAAGWERIPEDSPEYDPEYATWRIP